MVCVAVAATPLAFVTALIESTIYNAVENDIEPDDVEENDEHSHHDQHNKHDHCRGSLSYMMVNNRLVAHHYARYNTIVM